MARWPDEFRIVVAALVLTVLGGCSGLPDAHEARICRMLIPAINPPESSFQVQSTTKAPGGGVEVRYAVRTASGHQRTRTLLCRFGTVLFDTNDRLVAAWSDGKELSEVRLAILKLFWLGSQESAAADPAPYLQLGYVPQISQPLAFVLQHVVSALPLIGIYAVLAPAYALVYGLIGRINLAFGEFAALGGYAALLGVPLAGALTFWPDVLAVSLALGLFAAGTHGYVASRFIFEPLHRASGQQVLIATVGLAMALQEYMRLSQGSALRWMEPFFNNPTAIAASEGFVVTVTPIGISVSAFAVFVALGLLAMMKWTRYGRSWRACADDPIAAALLGVNFRGLLMTTFVLACGLAGLAGTIVTFYYGGVGFAGGIVFGLKALIAAIAGGIGSIPGALLGAILIGGAEMVWSILFPIEYRDLAIYTLLAALLIWRPEGLLGARHGLYR